MKSEKLMNPKDETGVAPVGESGWIAPQNKVRELRTIPATQISELALNSQNAIVNGASEDVRTPVRPSVCGVLASILPSNHIIPGLDRKSSASVLALL